MENLLKSLFENKGNVANEQVIESAHKIGIDNTNLNRFFDVLDENSESEMDISYPFYAKFYDNLGNNIGEYGIGSPKTEKQIYIVSFKMLGLKEDSTPKQIVEKIGIEDNSNRMMPTEIDTEKFVSIAELKLNKGVFKLPPKSHRDEIKKAVEDTYSDTMDYEIGGCGYHKSNGAFLHLRAEDGKPATVGNPTVEVFKAVDFDQKVEKADIEKYASGVRAIKAAKVEYTWHTYPPKTNPLSAQQAPSMRDRSFSGNYDEIKQHFLVSFKFKKVFYFGFGMEWQANVKYVKEFEHGEAGGFNILVDFNTFFEKL